MGDFMKNVNNNALTFEQRIEAQKTIDQRKSTLSRYGTVLLFFGPYLFFFCLFFVYPIIQGVGNPDRIFVGWQNYHDIIIGNADIATYKIYFDEGLLHTLYFVLLTVPFLIVVPFILALLLNQKPWGESFFRALFFLPNVLSVSTVCILFRYVFNPERGLIKGFNFESDLASAWFVLVIVTVWWTVGNNMVIMNAERFGLSQLHQLRGRVGRGSEKSWCFLLVGSDSETARERLTVFKNTSDGFALAEKDLGLRGSGDFLGTRQSGKFLTDIKNLRYSTDVIFTAKKLTDEAFERRLGLDAVKKAAMQKYESLKDIVLN